MLTRRLLPFLFVLWWALLALALKAITLDAGELPVDYRTYAEASARVAATGSPYAAPKEAQATWRRMHESALAAFRPAEAPEGAAGVVSGPYLYPPGLALLLAPGPGVALAFLLVHSLATLALVMGWLRAAGLRAGWWLVPAALSADLLAVYAGGNVELILLAVALAASWMFWQGFALPAATLAAVVILVKPQFLLLFAGVAALSLLRPGAGPGPVLRGGALCLALVVLDAAFWPDPARRDFLAYLADPSAYQVFALPAAEQWPMAIWNRAPVQALLSLGLGYGAAQGLALALWAALLGLSLVLLRRRAPGFALAFALAYALFLLGRPILWALPMLGLFVLGAAWPRLGPASRRLLAAAAGLVGLTHWAAFVLFLRGEAPGLLTLQTPALPWETALVLPGAVAVLLWAARRDGPPPRRDDS